MTIGLNRTSPLRQQTISADFFTNTHRFSATVVTGNRRLIDIVNNRIESSLEVKDAYISRIEQPGEIIGTYEVASLVKESINFIIVTSETEGISQKRRTNSFIGQVRKDIFLVTTPFEVEGKLEVFGKIDLKELLSTSITTFMTIFAASAVDITNPDTTFTGAALLINKTTIDFFSALQND